MPTPKTRPQSVRPRDTARRPRSATAGSRCLRVQIIAVNQDDISRLQALLVADPDLVIVEAATLSERGSGPLTADVDVVVVDAGHVTTADLAELMAWVERPLVILGVNYIALDQWPLTAGGIAMLKRDTGFEELTAAIRAVVQALLVVDARLIESAQAGRDDRQPDAVEPLSSRELDVLRRMAEGWPNKEIARRLGISEHTVKFHVSSILSKLRTRTRTQAVTVAARRGLIAL